MFSRVLIGVTDSSSAENVSALLSSTGVDLLISRVLSSGTTDAMERAQAIQYLYSSHSQTKLAWSLGGQAEGHIGSLVSQALVKLHQLLLMTLPGTPIFNYGDEIGLMDKVRRVNTKEQTSYFDISSVVLLFITFLEDRAKMHFNCNYISISD